MIMSSICPPQECVKTGLFQHRNALFPTVLYDPVAPQTHDWHTNALSLSVRANVWCADTRADTRGHPGRRPKSTTAICREDGEASPKCRRVNCRPAGLRALIKDEWMREQASAAALRDCSQDSYGWKKNAEMKTLQVGGGGRRADWLADEHSGASGEAERKIFS